MLRGFLGERYVSSYQEAIADSVKTGSTHRYQNLARTRVSVSTVSDEVIVEDKHVALIPWEHHGITPKDFTDSIQIFVKYCAAVPVIRVSRQILDATSAKQWTTVPFVEIRDVP